MPDPNSFWIVAFRPGSIQAHCFSHFLQLTLTSLESALTDSDDSVTDLTDRLGSLSIPNKAQASSGLRHLQIHTPEFKVSIPGTPACVYLCFGPGPDERQVLG